MNQFDFTYNFHVIAEKTKKGHLQRIDHIADKNYEPRAAVNDIQLLMNTSSHQVSSLLADLTDIAVAVYVADRLSKRIKERTCLLRINLPIRSPELLDHSSIREELQKILYWFTEDLWFFNFIPYVKDGRSVEINKRLPFPEEPHPRRVALWSGGLDALAGLYDQLLQEQTRYYTLFGTGGNEMILSAQRRVATKIREGFPERIKLIQIPIRLTRGGSQTSSSARARGFVFMLLGAICALQEKQNTLYIHENGIGAINLPFRDSEVGLDHSRSVHPLSLARMSKLLSSILEKPFTFENPLLFSTKAQECTQLLRARPDLAFQTISCDRRHRSNPMQCGYCSSCLLRRQAIAACEKEDQTRYQITEFPGGQKESIRRRTHLAAMLAQVDILKSVFSKRDSWQSMSQHYPTLDEIVRKTCRPGIGNQSIMSNQLLNLYRNYVSEWDKVRNTMKQGLLE